jgi:hypothetical protein
MGLLHVPVDEKNKIPPVTAMNLFIPGGSMSVNDKDEFPWLKNREADHP